MQKLLLATGLAGLLGATASSLAMAQVPAFTAVDADANGEVTLAEALDAGLTWSDAEFMAADQDQSGTLSREEFEAAIGG